MVEMYDPFQNIFRFFPIWLYTHATFCTLRDLYFQSAVSSRDAEFEHLECTKVRVYEMGEEQKQCMF
jgi:hypothetical protein